MAFSGELNQRIVNRPYWFSRSTQDKRGKWNFENIKESEVTEGDNVYFDYKGCANDDDYKAVEQVLAQHDLHMTYPKEVGTKSNVMQFLILPILEGTPA
tara:strand:- start:2371 stop:2667 length:297 start_codon:yes stop_codon:yes gene_type:complete